MIIYIFYHQYVHTRQTRLKTSINESFNHVIYIVTVDVVQNLFAERDVRSTKALIKKWLKKNDIDLFVRSINSFEKSFNSSDDDDDIKLIIQKQTHLVQIHCKTIINSIKKCFFHDLVDDFRRITSADRKNHRCI